MVISKISGKEGKLVSYTQIFQNKNGYHEFPFDLIFVPEFPEFSVTCITFDRCGTEILQALIQVKDMLPLISPFMCGILL